MGAGAGHGGFAWGPLEAGFDYFFGYLSQNRAHNFYSEFLMRNAERVRLRNKGIPFQRYDGMSGMTIERVDYSHDLFVAKALEWITGPASRPFFLSLTLTIPHANNEAGGLDGSGAPGMQRVEGILGTRRERIGWRCRTRACTRKRTGQGLRRGSPR